MKEVRKELKGKMEEEQEQEIPEMTMEEGRARDIQEKKMEKGQERISKRRRWDRGRRWISMRRRKEREGSRRYYIGRREFILPLPWRRIHIATVECEETTARDQQRKNNKYDHRSDHTRQIWAWWWRWWCWRGGRVGGEKVWINCWRSGERRAKRIAVTTTLTRANWGINDTTMTISTLVMATPVDPVIEEID